MGLFYLSFTSLTSIPAISSIWMRANGEGMRLDREVNEGKDTTRRIHPSSHCRSGCKVGELGRYDMNQEIGVECMYLPLAVGIRGVGSVSKGRY